MRPRRLHIGHEHFRLDYLNLYWKFVHERQWVWYRRSVLQTPPPWTSDPILRVEFINQMYRELDPGTEYALRMLEGTEGALLDRVFALTLYRLLGSNSTFFESLRPVTLETFHPRTMLIALEAHRAAKGNPLGDAYRVAPYHTMGTSNKFENITRLVEKLVPVYPAIFQKVTAAASAREAYDAFKLTEGFGDFLSYQIIVDLITPLPGGGTVLPFSQNDWAVAGPGAKQGAAKLLTPSYRPGSYLPMMQWLRDNQEEEFARLGLNFPYLKNTDGTVRMLSLSNIQSTLCEFNKFSRLVEGQQPVRKFYPSTKPSELTRWDCVHHDEPTYPVATVRPPVVEAPVQQALTPAPSVGGDQVVVFVMGVLGEPEAVSKVVVSTIEVMTSSFQHLHFVSSAVAGGELLQSADADQGVDELLVPKQELDYPRELVHPRVTEGRSKRRVLHTDHIGLEVSNLSEDSGGDLTYAGLENLGGFGPDAFGAEDVDAVFEDNEAGATQT